PDAGAQRRPAPDDRRRAGRPWARDARASAGHRHDRPDRPARPAPSGRGAQQPGGLGLCGAAQDARPGRGGLHRRAVRRGRRRAGPQAQHPEGGHHGRGAPHHGQPEGLHCGCEGQGGLHQHRLPGPHGRRDPHGDGRRPRRPQGGGAGQQRPGHPRLRRALGGSGRRLLQGAGHPRRGPDGGPGDSAHLQPASGQLAAPRRHDRRRGHGGAEAHGRGGGSPERGRAGLSPAGAGL
uniref:Two-component transcriptional response regulator, LuxR family n=1 Tax=Parastrongyloides trichosuri TaxID=131310 RepID=A0A0N4ZXV3_PARTI